MSSSGVERSGTILVVILLLEKMEGFFFPYSMKVLLYFLVYINIWFLLLTLILSYWMFSKFKQLLCISVSNYQELQS